MSYTKIYDIKGTVEKKGRKYFQVKIDDKYKSQLVIDSNTEHLKEGDTFSFKAVVEIETSRFGSKFTYTKVTDEMLADIKNAENEKEVQKWLGYVENSFKENRVYENGLKKLKELNFDISIFDERISKIKQAKEKEYTEKTIENYKGYVRNAMEEGYVYYKGIEKLHSLGCHDLDKEIEEFQNQFTTFYLDNSYQIKKGDIFVIEGKCYKTASCSYRNELTYGSIDKYHNTFDNDCITFARARDISETAEGKKRIRDYQTYNQCSDILNRISSKTNAVKELLYNHVLEYGETSSYSDFKNLDINIYSSYKEFRIDNEFLYAYKKGYWEYDIPDTYKKCSIAEFADIVEKLQILEQDYDALNTFLSQNTYWNNSGCYTSIFQEGNYDEISSVEFQSHDILNDLQIFIDNFSSVKEDIEKDNELNYDDEER